MISQYLTLVFLRVRYLQTSSNEKRFLLLLTFEESDIFVRATRVEHDASKLPTLRPRSVRLVEQVGCIHRRDHLVFPLLASRRRLRR